MTIIIYIGAFVLAVVGNSLFAGMETAIVGLRATQVAKLRKRGGAQAAQAKQLIGILAQKENFLGAMLIGVIICNTIAAVSVTLVFEAWLGRTWLSVLGATVVALSYLLIIGQITPKLFFRQNTLETALATAWLMNAAYLAFAPLSKSFGRISSVLVHLAGKTAPPRFTFVTREELKLLTPRPATASGAVLDATAMIHGVFDMRQKLARDLMIPFEKAVTVPADATVEQVLEQARKTNHSRLPVIDTAARIPDKAGIAYDSPRGKIVGLVNCYDILYSAENDTRKTAQDFLRRPPVLADTEPLDRALQKLRAARLPMAIVINAEQKAVGIITVENIVAQIVGKV